MNSEINNIPISSDNILYKDGYGLNEKIHFGIMGYDKTTPCNGGSIDYDGTYQECMSCGYNRSWGATGNDEYDSDHPVRVKDYTSEWADFGLLMARLKSYEAEITISDTPNGISVIIESGDAWACAYGEQINRILTPDLAYLVDPLLKVVASAADKWWSRKTIKRVRGDCLL
jgi:hypothetical protein